MDNHLRARGIPSRRQSGVVLVAFAALLAIVSVGLMVDKLSTRAQGNAARDASSSEALARAKADLIAWSVSHPTEPGRLPWPDRNGEATPNYDGLSDCVTTGFNNSHLLGRLPHAGDAAPCQVAPLGNPIVDGYGEPLWYAVSRNLLWNRGQGGADPPLNPGLMDGGASYPWLTVRDQNGNVLSNRVAAVIIAPGDVMGNQARSGTAPNPNQYLDSVTVGGTTYSNSDSNLDFILYPDSRKTPADSDAFNDRLVYITIDELMRPVEKRVLGDAAVVLEQYRAAHGRFPWLSPYRDPTLYAAADTLTGRVDSVSGDHIIDADGNFPSSGLDDHLIVNVTRGTQWEIKDQHDPDDLHLKGSPDFQAGDAYNIRPAYNGVWGRREGHIPYIDGAAGEQYAFTTGFTLTWQNGTATGLPSCGSLLDVLLDLILGAIGCGQVQNSGYESGSFTQPPPVVPATAAADGESIWHNDIDRVDAHCHSANCDGLVETRNNAYTVQLCILTCLITTDLPVKRELTYTFDFSGDGSITSVGNVKTRRVASTSPQTIGVVDTVVYNGDTVTIWNGTVVVPAGDYVMDGIYYEVADADFPPYFFTNRWHHYIYGKIGADLVATNTNTGNPSDGDCETVAPPCLDLDIGGSAVRSDVQAALVGAGGQLAGQTRSNGNLSDYFESDNAAQGNDTVARGVIAGGFNDQVRVIRPNPP